MVDVCLGEPSPLKSTVGVRLNDRQECQIDLLKTIFEGLDVPVDRALGLRMSWELLKIVCHPFKLSSQSHK